jgi:hypothetical protein
MDPAQSLTQSDGLEMDEEEEEESAEAECSTAELMASEDQCA